MGLQAGSPSGTAGPLTSGTSAFSSPLVPVAGLAGFLVDIVLPFPQKTSPPLRRCPRPLITETQSTCSALQARIRNNIHGGLASTTFIMPCFKDYQRPAEPLQDC